MSESIRSITFLELPQNLAHDAATTTPKSLVLRVRTCSFSTTNVIHF
jgi:hypothetical protein